MENRGWIVVAGMFACALMLAGCGAGDANEGGNDLGDDGVTDDVGPDDAAPSCGNGTCETGEGCESCADDCACTTEYTACRNDACVDWDSINPLLKKIEGHWTWLQPPSSNESDVYVDIDDPTCAYTGDSTGQLNGQPQGDLGDACVHGLYPSEMVVSGSALQFYAPYDSTLYANGQVLEDGTRAEIDFHQGGISELIILVKDQ